MNCLSPCVALLALASIAPQAHAQSLAYEWVQSERVYGSQNFQAMRKLPASLLPSLVQAKTLGIFSFPFRMEIVNSAPFEVDGARVRVFHGQGFFVGSGGGGFPCWGQDYTTIDSVTPVPTLRAGATVEYSGSVQWQVGPRTPSFTLCDDTGLVGDGKVSIDQASSFIAANLEAPTGLEGFLAGNLLLSNSYLDMEISYSLDLPALGADTSCTSAPNSTGSATALGAFGSAAASDDVLVLHCTAAPPAELGYFLMGQVPAQVPGFGGGQGTLCIGAPQLRFRSDVLLVDAAGSVTFRPPLDALPQGAVVIPGESWIFQFWHRDRNPNPTHNTSNGLSLVFG